VVALGALGQQGGVDPDRDHPGRAVTDRLAVALVQLVEVEAAFGLVRPVLDVLLGDRLPLRESVRGRERPPRAGWR
jgi:hypothetical protein